MAIASGQDNLANVCARTGYDWREVLEQRAKEKAYIKELEAKYNISLEGGTASAKTTEQEATGGTENDKGSGNN
jgi:hypothetical protein